MPPGLGWPRERWAMPPGPRGPARPRVRLALLVLVEQAALVERAVLVEQVVSEQLAHWG